MFESVTKLRVLDSWHVSTVLLTFYSSSPSLVTVRKGCQPFCHSRCLYCVLNCISVLQFHLYLVLLPIDGQSIPNLEKPYLSCRPTLSVQHLVKVIACLNKYVLGF